MRKYPGTAWVTLGSALFALAPKCPVCFLAYFGVFGVATASASAYRVWLPTVTVIWLTLTVAMLALRTDRIRRYGPVAMGVVAGAGVFGGKFIIASQLMLYAGVGALIIAAGWSAWSRTSAERASCVQCEPQPRLTEQGSQARS